MENNTAGFIGNPLVEYLGGSPVKFRLQKPFKFYTTNEKVMRDIDIRVLGPFNNWSLEERRADFVVPSNIVCDGASVPRIFWGILPPNGKYGKATFLHDYHYSLIRRIKSKRQRRKYRKVADQIFLEGMKVLGVGLLTRQSMYWALRGFGK